jgi:hypothetical protein
VVADGLAGEADLPEKVAALEDVELGLRHPVGLAFQVLDAAGGALRVSAATVQYVYPSILFDREDQPLAIGNIETPHTLYL